MQVGNKIKLDMNIKWMRLVIFFVVLIITTLVMDFVRISKYEIYPRKPSEKLNMQHDQIY